MKRLKFPPFKDILIVDDAATIHALIKNEQVDRRFELHFLLNRFHIKRALRNLSYKGVRFPHMTTRNDAVRLARHDQLWERFNANVATMASGPDELEAVAGWIRHGTPDQEPGILVQQIIGQFFNPNFQATSGSWAAALILHEDASSKNLLKILWWRLRGKGRRAKELLASTVNDDMVAIHGIGVAVHNLVASVLRLRSLYADNAIKKKLTPDEAVDLSLTAPPVVLRQALAKGAANGCPFSKYTLFLLKLKDANQDNKAKELIFMTDSWSRCPAEHWIPAVIAGIWKRVTPSE
jgi:hypothetical protein